MKISVLFLLFGILILGACAANQPIVSGPIDKGTTITAIAPRYNAGDEWTFKHVQRGIYTVKVIAIEKDNIITTQSDMGFREYRDGNFTINKIEGDITGRLATGSKLLDFPLLIGKSWNYPIQTPTFRGETAIRIIGYEKITIPAGSYDAFKLEGKWFGPTNPRGGTIQYWYAPSVKQIIKLIDDKKNWDSEMISFSLK
jgi:hypothetical protein